MKLRVLLPLSVFVLFPLVASAQVTIAPTQASFVHADVDFNATAAYRLDFYACTSVTQAGLCVGRSSTPFQTAGQVLKSAVSGSATARTFPMSALTPAVLPSMPIGVAFVSTIIAIGDTAVPGVVGNSPPSADSNAFFAQGRTPASPAALSIR